MKQFLIFLLVLFCNGCVLINEDFLGLDEFLMEEYEQHFTSDTLQEYDRLVKEEGWEPTLYKGNLVLVKNGQVYDIFGLLGNKE